MSSYRVRYIELVREVNLVKRRWVRQFAYGYYGIMMHVQSSKLNQESLFVTVHPKHAAFYLATRNSALCTRSPAALLTND